MNYIKTLCLLAVVTMLSSCNAQKKIDTTKMQVLQPATPLMVPESIAPSTCNLQLGNCKLIEKNKRWTLSGEITNILGYGSGFSADINNGDKLLIRVNAALAKTIKKQSTISCNISYENTFGGGGYYQLIKILPTSSNKK